MKNLVKGAALSGAGALLLGASLALSSAVPVFGASSNRLHHDGKRTKSYSCNSSSPCLSAKNTTGWAVSGTSDYGYGIQGSSSNQAGVNGYASNSWGGYFSNDYAYNGGGGIYTLEAVANNPAGSPFAACGNQGSSRGVFCFTVDNVADGVFAGSVTAQSFKTKLLSRGGRRISANVALTPRATIEDTGTARLLEGEGTVRFDPVYASTIDANRGYQVFLTPNGDTRGLYVAAKYQGGFVVREVEHGRSSLYFDYRVVAYPIS